MNAFTDESRAASRRTGIEEAATTEETAAGARSAPTDADLPAEESAPADEPLPFSLRIEKGHAEPEELAALTVVLRARLAGGYPYVDGDRPEARPADRRHPQGHRAGRSACWSGCWTCS
ncbi:acyl-CoA carboxylase subunit epsilon [Streptomyces sp. NPDC020742]|uniref:acyl-CoA carboxylase subunit epsilon n=1 Tax=unclassified Streptomyces TaxID=2593676 RepID=UPI0033C6E7AB